MPYRPEAELKRPDLKGHFLCGHCGKSFCHAASLNRHRLNFHGDDQTCEICNVRITHNDTIRRHMQDVHHLDRVFTCGCCNWTFPDKKELHAHNNSMQKTGSPGEAKAIATSNRPPGSLAQHELRGEERAPRPKKRTSKAAAAAAAAAAANPQQETGDQLVAMLKKMLAANAKKAAALPVVTPPPVIPPTWMNQLLTLAPALLPFLQMTPSPALSMVSPSEAETADSDQPSTSSSSSSPAPLTSMLSAMFMNNNLGDAAAAAIAAQQAATPSTVSVEDDSSSKEEEEIDIVDTKDMLVKAVGSEFLSVKTEQPSSSSMSSGPESGIGSAPISNTPSPVSSIHGDNSGLTTPEKSSATQLLQDFLATAKVHKRRVAAAAAGGPPAKQPRL